MRTRLTTQLRALGSDELPATIGLGGTAYHKLRELKHDFFAATGVYESSPVSSRCCPDGGESAPARKIVLKIGRTASLFGLPLEWVGRLLADHECAIYRRLEGIAGVPALLARFGRTGLVHAYIEGGNLLEHGQVDDAFFDRLAALLRAIHTREVAYADLEKRTNILVAIDGKPHLVDFQISWYVRASRGGRTWPARLLLRWLQRADWHHFRKHQARHRPDLMSPWEIEDLLARPRAVKWYSRLARPLTWVRRRALWRLGQRHSPRVRGEETDATTQVRV